MEELKRTVLISEIPITMAECYCPYCDKEKSFIWDTTQDFVVLQCPGCSKMYEVSKK